MKSYFQLTFDNGQTALATRIEQQAKLPNALEEIGLCGSRSVLVLVGGASIYGKYFYLLLPQG